MNQRQLRTAGLGTALRASSRASWGGARGRSLALALIIVVNAIATAATAVFLSRGVSAAGEGEANPTWLLIGAAAACVGVTHLGFRVQFSLNRVIVEHAYLRLRRDVALACASRRTVDHLENPRAKDRIDVVKRNSAHIAEIAWTLLESASLLFQLAVSIYLLVSVSPALIFLVALAAPALYLNKRGTEVEARSYQPWARRTRISDGLISLLAEDRHRPEVLHHGAGERVARDASAAWDEATRIEYHAAFARAVYGFAGLAIFLAGYITAIVIASNQGGNGQEQVASIVLVAVLSAQLQGQVGHAAWLTGQLTRAAGAASDFDWVMSLAATEPQGQQRDAVPGLEAVTFSYEGTSGPALDAVTLTLPPGRTTAVVGTNGSGKSTLVKLLLGLYEADAGHASVEQLAPRNRDQPPAAQAAAAFQDFVAWEFRLGEVVALGDTSNWEDTDGIERALRNAQAIDLEARYGLDAELGDSLGGAQPSQGQWQKLAVARAMFKEGAAVVVLDEPTAALDPVAEKQLFDDYTKLSKQRGTTTVLVSHRFSTVAHADNIVVLDRGAVVESGTHLELVAIPDGVYQRMYQRQASAYLD